MARRASSNSKGRTNQEVAPVSHWYGYGPPPDEEVHNSQLSSQGEAIGKPATAKPELADKFYQLAHAGMLSQWQLSNAERGRLWRRANGFPQALDRKRLPRSDTACDHREHEIESTLAVPSSDLAARTNHHEDEIQAIIDATGLCLTTSESTHSYDVGIIEIDTATKHARAKSALSYDIGIAETLYWTALDIRRFRDTQNNLQLIYKGAIHLRNLLDEDAWRSIAPHMPLSFEVNSENLTFSRESLGILLRATRKALSSMSNSARVLRDELPSDILISQLMEAFEKNFGADAIASRGKEYSHYLRFVKIVLRKRGLPKYKPETIIKATSRARKAKRAGKSRAARLGKS